MQHLEHWPISRLIEYARNPRKNDHAVDSIAAAIKEFGFRVPILAKSDGLVVDGHLRLKAAKKIGLAEVPVILADDMTDAQIKAFRISVNKMAELAEWDEDMLALELADLKLEGFDLDLTGFDPGELDELLADEPPDGLTDPDAVPETPVTPVSQKGDVWIMGKHRLMCGDSTDAATVEKLMDGATAQLLHADPPYGMGKESDGVLNDNLYADKLDAFQMAWWRAFRPALADNAGAYIWGNAPDLWRLWYRGGLADSERLTMRNEIAWDKREDNPTMLVSGVPLESRRMYHPTERCLFFMLGEQGFNNNADNYWEGWEPIRAYLDGERKASGLTTAQCNEICGKQNMTQPAFTKGGFRLIARDDYEKLRAATGGKCFKRDHDALKRDHDALKRDHDALKRDFYATRAHFDNTHDNMTDVWEFQRVIGEDRHGHATPKPVAMIERVMKSSLPVGGLCVEPFSGSGTTLIAAEKTARRCYAMELSPQYCDVAVKRWQQFTGQQAIHAVTGVPFPAAPAP